MNTKTISTQESNQGLHGGVVSKSLPASAYHTGPGSSYSSSNSIKLPLGKQENVDQTFGFLHMWETQMKKLATDLRLAQPSSDYWGTKSAN